MPIPAARSNSMNKEAYLAIGETRLGELLQEGNSSTDSDRMSSKESIQFTPLRMQRQHAYIEIQRVDSSDEEEEENVGLYEKGSAKVKPNWQQLSDVEKYDEIITMIENIPSVGTNPHDSLFFQRFAQTEALKSIFTKLKDVCQTQSPRPTNSVPVLNSTTARYDPRVNYGNFRRELEEMMNSDMKNNQIQEENEKQELEKYLKNQKIFEAIELQKYKETWQDEVKEFPQEIKDKSKEIRVKFGFIGMLIYGRMSVMSQRHEYAAKRVNSGFKDKDSEDQMMLNNFKDVPKTAYGFLSFLIERIVNILSYEKYRLETIDINHINRVHDQILPTLHELKSLLKQNIMTSRDAIIFKLLVHYHLLMSYQHGKFEKRKVAVKCALTLHKKISQSQIAQISDEIHEIGEKLKVQNIHEQKLQIIREKLQPIIDNNEYVGNFMINLYGLQTILKRPIYENQNQLKKVETPCTSSFFDEIDSISKMKKQSILAKFESELLHLRNQETFKQSKKSRKVKKSVI